MPDDQPVQGKDGSMQDNHLVPYPVMIKLTITDDPVKWSAWFMASEY